MRKAFLKLEGKPKTEASDIGIFKTRVIYGTLGYKVLWFFFMFFFLNYSFARTNEIISKYCIFVSCQLTYWVCEFLSLQPWSPFKTKLASLEKAVRGLGSFVCYMSYRVTPLKHIF